MGAGCGREVAAAAGADSWSWPREPCAVQFVSANSLLSNCPSCGTRIVGAHPDFACRNCGAEASVCADCFPSGMGVALQNKDGWHYHCQLACFMVDVCDVFDIELADRSRGWWLPEYTARMGPAGSCLRSASFAALRASIPPVLPRDLGAIVYMYACPWFYWKRPVGMSTTAIQRVWYCENCRRIRRRRLQPRRVNHYDVYMRRVAGRPL